VRRDHKPYALKRLLGYFEDFWVHHFIAPQLESMGTQAMIMKPWHLKIYGRNIHFGEAVHVITSKDRTVRLTTWDHDDGTGSIHIDDYALLCPGVRIDSASCVRVGSNTMLAAGVYLTDADWHGIYNRPRPIGKTLPITLEDNVWLGDGVVVCKGVNIGANTIVGAGSVVTKSLPANVIAAGNPAVVVRQLDAAQTMTRRVDLLGKPGLTRDIDLLEQLMRKDNSWWRWLRTVVSPSRKD
jgi:acetyltransferase-like isoleucine patch superfamily enzyme